MLKKRKSLDVIKPFTTDGCSGGMSIFWRVVFKGPPPWEGRAWNMTVLTGKAARANSEKRLMNCYGSE